MISSKTIFCVRSAAWEILMSSRRFRTCSGRMVKCILCFALSFFRRTYIILEMAKKLLAFYAVWHWLRLEASCCLTTRVLDVSPRLCLTIRRLYSKYQQERFVLRKSVKISMQERLCWLNILIEGSELTDVWRISLHLLRIRSLAKNNRPKIS